MHSKLKNLIMRKLLEIVNSDDSLVMHNETMRNIDLLCAEYDIEPEIEGDESENDPSFWIANVIMHNELMREKAKAHTRTLETSLEK